MPCVGGTLSVHTPVFGLVLSLASTESPVRAYLTADCREHRVFFLLPYVHTMYGFCSFVGAQPVLRTKHISLIRNSTDRLC